MGLCNGSCLSARQFTFNVGHYAQTFQQISFIFAMPVGIIDFHHFIPFSLTFTLAGLTSSAQNKISCLRFLKHFSSEWDTIWCGDEAIQAEHPDAIFE